MAGRAAGARPRELPGPEAQVPGDRTDMRRRSYLRALRAQANGGTGRLRRAASSEGSHDGSPEFATAKAKWAAQRRRHGDRTV